MKGALFVAALFLFIACRTPSGGGTDAGISLDANSADAAPQGVCDPYEARPQIPEVFIGPEGLEDRLLSYINAAQTELWVLMYLITLDQFVDAIVAAHQRGVSVRVILDRAHPGNVDARASLLANGVPMKNSPEEFTHSHSKVFLIDNSMAVVMSSNLNYWSMISERNYGVVNRDTDDIADIRAIIERDWSGGAFPDLNCTRLFVSPNNSRQRMLQHINTAAESIAASVMYISDESIRTALVQRQEAGVQVRVLLADPEWMDGNAETADFLLNNGVQVRVMKDVQLHAKLVIADDIPFLGSQNLSFTSLTANREVGLLVNNEVQAQRVITQFEADWNVGVAP